MCMIGLSFGEVSFSSKKKIKVGYQIFLNGSGGFNFFMNAFVFSDRKMEILNQLQCYCFLCETLISWSSCVTPPLI